MSKKVKIELTIPIELKQELFNLSNDLEMSESEIFSEALNTYALSEIVKWEIAGILSSKDKEYMKTIKHE